MCRAGKGAGGVGASGGRPGGRRAPGPPRGLVPCVLTPCCQINLPSGARTGTRAAPQAAPLTARRLRSRPLPQPPEGRPGSSPAAAGYQACAQAGQPRAPHARAAPGAAVSDRSPSACSGSAGRAVLLEGLHCVWYTAACESGLLLLMGGWRDRSRVLLAARVGRRRAVHTASSGCWGADRSAPAAAGAVAQAALAFLGPW